MSELNKASCACGADIHEPFPGEAMPERCWKCEQTAKLVSTKMKPIGAKGREKQVEPFDRTNEREFQASYRNQKL